MDKKPIGSYKVTLTGLKLDDEESADIYYYSYYDLQTQPYI